MIIDPTHPANRLVVEDLRTSAPHDRPLTPAADAADPYHECGTHPELVERLWDELGRGLPDDARCLVYGRPALVQPVSGVVLALGMGTRYVLRLPQERVPQALAAGSFQVHRWGPDLVTDLATLYGPDWVFGTGSRQEALWLGEAYARFDVPAPDSGERITPAVPARAPGPVGATLLEVTEAPGYKPRTIADPDSATLGETFRALSWATWTAVTVRKDERHHLEVSGSLEDGLSASHVEDGIEHVTLEPPASLELLLALLESYRAADGRWRTLVAWD